MIAPQIKTKIQQVINCFETGSPKGKYDAISKYNDGPGNIKQITYGRSQTTEFGNLKKLLEEYVGNNGQYATAIKPYLLKIGKQPGLCDDIAFCNLLKAAGKNDPVMQSSQDEFFDSVYYEPALGWFKHMGFTLPLSLLVIYDSFVHSGGVPDILRNRFPEKVPLKGGSEKEWIKQYVNVRYDWLANHSRVILRSTVYRPDCFKKEISKNNWDLVQPVQANGITVV
jgi:chitosanase